MSYRPLKESSTFVSSGIPSVPLSARPTVRADHSRSERSTYATSIARRLHETFPHLFHYKAQAQRTGFQYGKQNNQP